MSAAQFSEPQWITPQAGTGAPSQQGAPPSQTQASPIMQLLGNWHRVSGEIGEVYPQIQAQMKKIADAVRDALMALVSLGPSAPQPEPEALTKK